MFTAADVATCSGFLGSWLLVAGPMFQGALELHAEDVDREALHRVKKSIPAPARISAWWWLLPPVLYLLQRRKTIRYRQKMFDAMTVEQREKILGFVNKATGWFIVSGGAVLLACQVTWQLVERFAMPVWSFWILVPVMLLGCTLNTTVRMVRTQRLVKPNAAPAAVTPPANQTSN